VGFFPEALEGFFPEASEVCFQRFQKFVSRGFRSGFFPEALEVGFFQRL